MPKTKKSILIGGAVAAAVAGVVMSAPTAAFANPTNKTYSTYEACEAEARTIRDNITGAECKLEVRGWPPVFRWRLHTYGV